MVHVLCLPIECIHFHFFLKSNREILNGFVTFCISSDKIFLYYMNVFVSLVSYYSKMYF